MKISLLALLFGFTSCQYTYDNANTLPEADTMAIIPPQSPKDTIREDLYIPSEHTINTKNTTPGEIVAFAKTLIGTTYLYGSTDPTKGFDCSGFITHVFNHFQIQVPRSSVGFTHVKKEIPLEDAKAGDLILFTGTDHTVYEVGHMGIIVSGGDDKQFIHSTSGKAYGVTITPINESYTRRFVKVIRVFEQNDAID